MYNYLAIHLFSSHIMLTGWVLNPIYICARMSFVVLHLSFDYVETGQVLLCVLLNVHN